MAAARWSRILGLALLAAPLSALMAQTKQTVLPVIGSAPETGGQFGIAVFRTRDPGDSLGTRPTSLIGNAVATSKGQQRAFLDYDRWSHGNASRFQVNAVVSRFPLPFYGYGAESPEIPFDYEPLTVDLSVIRSKKTGAASWTYAGLRGVLTDVEGPFDTITPPLSCDCAPGWPQGAYRLALGTVGWMRDTRDNLFAPARGGFVDVGLSAGPLYRSQAVGRDLFVRLRVDARVYRSTPRGHTVAAQVAFMDHNSTAVPVDQLALLGHHTLNRGYTMGRYRDRAMLSSQVEWRSPMGGWRERLGVAAFAGVASLGGEMPLLRGRLLPSGGMGLRLRMDPRTRSAIRVDYAVGASGQSGLYVAFNEAF